MTSIDPIINDMRESGCNSCSCDLATYDESGEEVRLYGTFCSPIPGSLMIDITAYNLTSGKEIWNETCDTGRMCTIPFSLINDWECFHSDEEE